MDVIGTYNDLQEIRIILYCGAGEIFFLKYVSRILLKGLLQSCETVFFFDHWGIFEGV